jgi:uncharacterized protein (DUF302 family)
MTSIEYNLSKRIKMTFARAVERITEELRKEGFGIVTTIDLRDIFKKKIDKDFKNYLILGACNPRYAYEILQIESKAGIFLPCNVVVQEHTDGEVEISIANPEYLVRGVEDLNLRTFATEVKEAMDAVLSRI